MFEESIFRSILALLFFVISLFSFPSYNVLANENQKSTQTKNQKVNNLKPNTLPQFKPHMLDHVYQGCPTNSSCPPRTGKRYKKWVDLLKQSKIKNTKHWTTINRFRQKQGIPLEIWSFPKGEKTEGLIHWDSHCQNHNQEGKKIQIALALAKDFKEVRKLEKNSQKIHIPRSLLLESSGKIKVYMVPRGIGPLYLNGKSLMYTKETEGVYYGLRIGPRGELSIVDPAVPRHYPKSVDCPDKLVKKFSHHSPPKELYTGVYCQSFWNQKTNIYQTMIFGWSCN